VGRGEEGAEGSDLSDRSDPADGVPGLGARAFCGGIGKAVEPGLVACGVDEAGGDANAADIRREGVAWNRGETVASMVAMATHGFTRAQTDAKIAVAWPKERFDATKAKKVLQFIQEAIGALQKRTSNIQY
jgi:hypothetical protein